MPAAFVWYLIVCAGLLGGWALHVLVFGADLAPPSDRVEIEGGRFMDASYLRPPAGDDGPDQ